MKRVLENLRNLWSTALLAKIIQHSNFLLPLQVLPIFAHMEARNTRETYMERNICVKNELIKAMLENKLYSKQVISKNHGSNATTC